jgi:chromosomal replication initiation ATPase DnaA
VSAGSDQFVLELPHRAALGAHDFLISPSNRVAADMIDLWPNWPHASMAVVAPAHAGKTHLGNVWRLKSGAARLEAPALTEADAPAAALFHLLNLVREHKLSMLLTSRTPPGEIEASLPDLRSRLRALPLVTIEPPDEVLLKAVLVKHFTDRQLIVEPGVIAYIALRMERSMEAAAVIVAAIDRTAMATHRKVTRALAAEVLAQAVGEAAGGRD